MTVDPTAADAKPLPTRAEEIVRQIAAYVRRGIMPREEWADELIKVAEAIAAWNTHPQPAPPGGEPDFHRWLDQKIAEWSAAGGFHDFAVAAKVIRDRLGLAARPNVEDAEVEAAITYLGDEVPEEKAIADLLERLAGDLHEVHAALRKLTMVARTSGGVAGGDPDLCAACDVAEAVLKTRTVDSVTHWMNGYAEMCQRAEAANAKLSEREAELAKAYDIIAHTLTPTDCFCGDIEVVTAAHASHAARQQQKASAEPTAREGE